MITRVQARPRLFRLFALLTLLLVGGTAGYHWIEGWGVADSLYMVIITLSTVGYGEVHGLSD